MAITIISKKKLAFRNPDASSDKDRFFTVEPLVMAAAPDWVAMDPMYAWAKETGTLTAMGPEPALDKKAKSKKGDAPAADEKGPVAK